MKNHESELREAAKNQMYANFYDVHLLSPLFAPNSQPNRSKDDKKSESVTVRLPKWVRDDLAEVAEQENLSISQLINNAIVNAISKHHDQKEARHIYLESMLKWKDEPPEMDEPPRMSDLHRMSNSINPLRDYLLKEDS